MQPIVENAIYQGVKPVPDGGNVSIAGRMEDNRLVITVRDDGVGMTPEQLEKVFLPRKDDSRGIGVLNVRNRIQLVFGEQYGLRYHSGNKGTRVEICLPVVEPTEVPAPLQEEANDEKV